MTVKLLEYPTENDWMEVKRRALVTIGKKPITPPSDEWKREILRARHSPIRYLRFSFLITDLPSWVSVHLCRHVHAQPYVKSQRNDRQSEYDRNKAPQDSPVDMIFDVNGEELITICAKRLCKQASKETREVVSIMARLVIDACPEYDGLLKPQCEWQGGICYEMNSCKKERDTN